MLMSIDLDALRSELGPSPETPVFACLEADHDSLGDLAKIARYLAFVDREVLSEFRQPQSAGTPPLAVPAQPGAPDRLEAVRPLAMEWQVLSAQIHGTLLQAAELARAALQLVRTGEAAASSRTT